MMSSAIKLALATCLTVPLLTACQSTCTGDARYDDYWCARNNLNKGVYRAQTAQLRSIASSRQQELQRAKSLLARRQQELAAARKRQAPGDQIATLEREIASLRAQIQSMMGG